ncbi:MAG TPA: hypothetical protein VD931_02915, partial [Baekduia sp.]|nr:hypothetical protein [Baekduia sp.]
DIGDLTGAVTTSGSCVAIFKKLAHNDIGVGTDTVTVTLSNALIREEEVQGKPGRRRLIIRPTWDGATRPLSVVAS